MNKSKKTNLEHPELQILPSAESSDHSKNPFKNMSLNDLLAALEMVIECEAILGKKSDPKPRYLQ